MNRENLTKLANFLMTLPDDQPDFDMKNFYSGDGVTAYVKEPHIPCGSTACAVGWGPAAGIPLDPKYLTDDRVEPVDWWAYYQEVFGLSQRHTYDEWEWCFSGEWGWGGVDNTPRGAAARILYMLDDNPVDSQWVGNSDYVEVYQHYKKDL